MSRCKVLNIKQSMSDNDHSVVAMLMEELTQWFEHNAIPPALARILLRAWLTCSDHNGEVQEDDFAAAVEKIWREEMANVS